MINKHKKQKDFYLKMKEWKSKYKTAEVDNVFCGEIINSQEKIKNKSTIIETPNSAKYEMQLDEIDKKTREIQKRQLKATKEAKDVYVR